MERRPDFSSIVLSAGRLSFQRPALLLVGLLAALPVFAENLLLRGQDLSSPQSLAASALSLSRHPWLAGFLLGVLLLLILRSFSKSALILGFVRLNRQDPSGGAAARVPLSFGSVFPLFLRALAIEAFAIVGYALLLCFLALPFFFAFRYNPASVGSLTSLSTLTFVALAAFIFFVAEYGVFYTLLSSLRIRPAIEAGLRLLGDNFLVSLAFGVLLIALSLVFTFFGNLVILSSAALFQNLTGMEPGGLLLWPILLFFLAWFALYETALWTLFFLKIASPKTPAQEESLPEKDPAFAPKVPGLPPLSSDD